MAILENNWRSKTLENLEKDYQDEPLEITRLVQRCQALRKKPLRYFDTEDLRLMIGQNLGLDYLVPLAIEVLSQDLFAEGDYFKGDLLKNVLSIDTEFWDINESYWQLLNNLVKDKRVIISEMKFETANFDKCKYNIHR